ncbi:MAG: methylmalonyl-CoA epimerase [Phototrophicales bacterium]|nr:MAG: methylmalonyl-CoA epimerase [Phototrophicales bacterium]
MAEFKINHVAIVVPDVDEALKFWRDALGLTLNHVERNEEEAVQIAFLPTGESEVELLAPITEDSGVAKYLAKKGAGLHHLCIEVEHIEAVLSRLVAHQIELINDTPKLRPNGIKYAFVHPKSTGGVLLELYELPK